jgi:GNAT superfamily N-acetyltransferase
MSPERFPAWLERSRDEYERDLIVTGESHEEARRHAAESMDGVFASGAPTALNAVFDLVDEHHRGRGIGREAMNLAEEYARSHGAQTLGLSVFAFNAAARTLYDSVGYEPVSVKMRTAL